VKFLDHPVGLKENVSAVGYLTVKII